MAMERREDAAWLAAAVWTKSGGATFEVAVRLAREGMRRSTTAQRLEDSEGRDDARRGGGGVSSVRYEGRRFEREGFWSLSL